MCTSSKFIIHILYYNRERCFIGSSVRFGSNLLQYGRSLKKMNSKTININI